MQLLLQTQLPQEIGGLCGGALYLHSDTASSTAALKRLQTLAEAYAARHADIGATADLLRGQIFVMQIDSPDDLWQVVDKQVPQFVAQKTIRLLVIDSIAGLYRTSAEEIVAAGGDTASAHGARAQHTMRLAARLKQLGHELDIAVVVINQVSDKPLDAAQRRVAAPWETGPCATTDGASMRVPALGAAWGCCVNTRIVLTRTSTLDGDDDEGASAAMPTAAAAAAQPTGAAAASGWRRWMHVAWSPRVPACSVPFEVRDAGVAGLAFG